MRRLLNEEEEATANKTAAITEAAADLRDVSTADGEKDSQQENPEVAAFDANAVRVAVEQNDDEINDDELSLINAIANLLPNNGDVPQDIAKPLCPLYIHKLRMIGATLSVKKDAARDYAVATARDMFWTVHDIGQPYIDHYFHELLGIYHLAEQRHRKSDCSSDEAKEIGRQIFDNTIEGSASVSVSKCGSGKATNRGMLHKIANGDYEQLGEEVNWHPHYAKEMGEDA